MESANIFNSHPFNSELPKELRIEVVIEASLSDFVNLVSIRIFSSVFVGISLFICL